MAYMGLSDSRIRRVGPVLTPAQIKAEFPLSKSGELTVLQGRKEIEDILAGTDDRMFAIVGPCSIHDPVAALEYARRLRELREQFASEICIVMRTYFEKPRTTIGWKGFINDPDLDDSFNINKGSLSARKLLTEIVETGLTCATEFLETRSPQFLDVSWAAIGARTVESQKYREMASGLSVPVGFKNGTEGSVQVAVDGITSAQHPHYFVGINEEEGTEEVLATLGNPWGHLVLRGGRRNGVCWPNYRPDHIIDAIKLLEKAGLPPRIVIDCSHANAEDDFLQQWQALRGALAFRISGSGRREVCGFMIESNLVEGKQSINANPLEYGKSVTDACVGWETTELMLKEAYETLKRHR